MSKSLAQRCAELDRLEQSRRETKTKNSRFQKFLEKSPFRIFEPLVSWGYYRWIPDESMPYEKDLSNVDVSHCLQSINLDGKPPRIAPNFYFSIRNQLPMEFAPLSPHEIHNQYPHNCPREVGLYVAAKRGLDLSTVDFYFGGSILECLANNRVEDETTVIVVKVPGTEILLVAAHRWYIQNANEPAFQFKRLVTGNKMDDPHDPSWACHVHTQRIGSKYTVLFGTAAEATNGMGELIMIKASNPRYWGSRMMFHMISSGSPEICRGRKGNQSTMLMDAEMELLDSIIEKAVARPSAVKMETTLLAHLKALKKKAKDLTHGQVHVLNFEESTSRLTLEPFPESSPAPVLLPDVTAELLQDAISGET